ncbi:hybrid sensor histidine kinase/response regulator [Mastigocoleus testarum]|uniref:histidine kinase n=1 Tax=Mastigocoleus testarum BC008 TaxID=371196 RepID=A0A0V7ZYB5_9CYAN|nr:response regulator [Mastigocoleus testarum]KST69489.1 two-component system sensor histidine kinase/response regulator [Mastigocoleus testarum BC008]KST69545.1 two-component system sensor histidine kinase/response regulator [Mastigocoleus testarum BC008]
MTTEILSKPKYILLVDDNPNNLKVLFEAIQGHGWKALMATNGESAIEQAEYAKPDLILLDVMMPGIDGFEACRRLKANSVTQDVPVIFMTALSDTTDKVKGLEIGAVDYITKPFQQEEVIARLKLHLNLSHLTHTLEQKVEERTAELSKSLEQLQKTQLQLIQSEKMSTLGQLVAGIGHEINNPLNSIVANTFHVQEYTSDMLEVLNLFQEKFAELDPSIAKLLQKIDLEFLNEDLPSLLKSMQHGVTRLEDISLSLRTFARSDISSKVEFQIHEGLNSTVMLLQHRLKSNQDHPEIEVVKDYGDLPPITCYPGQINQVFMNLIANAIDAFEELNRNRSYQEITADPNIITVKTRVNDEKNTVTICIKDNGIGLNPQLQDEIFEQTFTTKAVGKGTGLGLAISHQIVVEKHNGEIELYSIPGQSTEFIVTLPIS